MQTIIDRYQAVIRAAAESKTPLRIRGGGTKDFYGNPAGEQNSTLLDMSDYNGIVDYEPTELVITARAGTRLADLEAELDRYGQMLAFEPPHFGAAATLGGCVAAGLSGPRRVAAGSVRDFVLGVRMLDGKGEDLRFGGQVMKNVAGYDVSRLMTGALGTLGVLLEVSLKVLPKPAVETTLCMAMHEAAAIEKMNQWAGKPLPVFATCFTGDQLFIRLSGAEPAVRAARVKLGGDLVQDDTVFWQSVREHTHDFFQPDQRLWRLSVKSTAPSFHLPGKQLLEWNGALRWLCATGADETEVIRRAAQEAGGHATLFRGDAVRTEVFHPLPLALMKIHRTLKEKFDPAGIFNPGRLYPGI
ncbi:glycolate oxidase subunit GlcE [Nitrosomonas sp.]|uniref:glycolate oxidase subunit GlcE n=1 Tax=Nitrosomonas sp. TaxID=42353 RepID=UPI0025E04B4B|nr:glycolate oxidase subunit GlcE [Nitrosomonas sp.]MBV6448125.1 hypothetical protein [Nitrosomonas sp.]